VQQWLSLPPAQGIVALPKSSSMSRPPHLRLTSCFASPRAAGNRCPTRLALASARRPWRLSCWRGQARYRAAPALWDDEDERRLALEALAGEKDPPAMLEQIAAAASTLVTQHWHQIAPAAAA